MQRGVWVLLICLAPCLPVALFGWRRASLKRTLVAEAWTVIASAITLVFVGFSALGDCDDRGPVCQQMRGSRSIDSPTGLMQNFWFLHQG